MPDILHSRSEDAEAAVAAQSAAVRRQKAGSMLRVLLPTMVVAGVLLAGWMGLQHFRHAASATSTRLAVLPFASLGVDPSHGFFADGLQEELLAALSQQAPDVGLISRTTVMSYRDHPKTINEIAAELHVTHVLESSVRRDAGFVTLNVQLIDAARDQNLWSKRYDRTVAQAQNLSSEVARDIAAQMGTRTMRPKFTAPVTHDQQAFDLYLKARAEMGVRVSLPRDTPVIDWLDEAIARDPEFMNAYLQRARARLFVHVGGADRSRKLVEAVREDIDTARRLAPDDPQVHWAESFYAVQVLGDVQQGLAQIDAARESGIFDPVWERLRAAALVGLGRVREALDICRRLVDLDPGNLATLVQCGRRGQEGREPKESLRYFDLALARDPDNEEVKVRRADLVAGYTGKLDAWRAVVDDPAVSKSGKSRLELQLLRFDRHYAEFMARSAELKPPSGSSPLAQVRWHWQRGQVALLLGNRKSAAADGRAILATAAAADPPAWERPYWLAAAAIGNLLVGKCDLAVRSAQDAMSLLPRARYGSWQYAAQPAAEVAAWCGRKEEAASLLEELSTGTLGLSPADIALDPVYAVPLGDHKGFQALKARLEQQMRDTKLE